MTPLWLHAALLRSAGADVQRAAVAVLRDKISAGLRLRLFLGGENRVQPHGRRTRLPHQRQYTGYWGHLVTQAARNDAKQNFCNGPVVFYSS